MSIPVLRRYFTEEMSHLNLQPAGMRERLMAQLIDGIILGAIISLILLLFSGGKVYSVWISPVFPIYLLHTLPGHLATTTDWWWGGYYRTISLPYLAVQKVAFPSPVQLLIYAVYYTSFHSVLGQTPGKMLKGLVVLNSNHQRLSGTRAFLRWLFSLVSLLPLGLGFWTAAGDSQKRGWHDRWSKSVVFKF